MHIPRLALLLLFAASLLPACGGGGGSAPGDDVPPGPLLIEGRVIHTQQLLPVPALDVIVDGTPLTTDADGRFSITVDTVPYTVVIRRNDDLEFFTGISRSDPTLQTKLRGSVPTDSGVLSGTRPNHPLPAGYGGILAMSFPDVLNYGGGGGSNINGSFSIARGWPAGVDGPAHFYALYYPRDPVTGIPTSFPAYAHDVFARSALSISNYTVSYAPIGVSTLSGTVTAPGGMSRRDRVGIRPTDAREMTLYDVQNASASFAYTVPAITDAHAELQFSANDGGDRYTYTTVRLSTAGASGLSVDLIDPVAMQAPPADATIDFDTVIAATVVPNHIYRYEFRVKGSNPMDPTEDWAVVYSASAQVRMPDLSDWGKAPPYGDAIEVTVSTYGPFASLDDATGPGGLRFAHGTGPLFETTTSRDFQFAPAP